MEKEEKIFGGTHGEGETSKNDPPKWTGPNQENVEPTNSDDSNASADSKAYAEQFMQTLNGQVNAINIERKDNKICRIVTSWVEKPTKEAKKFLEKGYTKYRYIGRKLGQAAVPFATGLDFLKSKYPDEDPNVIESAYRRGYGEVDYDVEFRKYLTKS